MILIVHKVIFLLWSCCNFPAPYACDSNPCFCFCYGRLHELSRLYGLVRYFSGVQQLFFHSLKRPF